MNSTQQGDVRGDRPDDVAVKRMHWNRMQVYVSLKLFLATLCLAVLVGAVVAVLQVSRVLDTAKTSHSGALRSRSQPTGSGVAE